MTIHAHTNQTDAEAEAGGDSATVAEIEKMVAVSVVKKEG